MVNENRFFIGIDLGTTNSTCTIIVKNGSTHSKITLPIYQLVKDPVNNTDCYGFENILPSVIWMKEGDIYCGKYCKNNIVDLSSHENSFVIKSIKNNIGSDTWQVQVQNTYFDPTDISFLILKTIARSIEKVRTEYNAVIDSIVVTIPSTFSSKMRRKTLRAARRCWKDNWNTINLIDEPVAAAFSDPEILNQKFNNGIETNTYMVIDIGGGTNDVSILSILENKEIRILGTSRYNNLAGDDFDLEIAALLLNKIKSRMEFNNQLEEGQPLLLSKLIALLLEQAEMIKIKLLSDVSFARGVGIDRLIEDFKDSPENYKIAIDNIPLAHLPPYIEVTSVEILETLKEIISRESYEQESKNNGNAAPRNIFTPVEQALKSCKRKNYINNILLTGGSSRFKPIVFEIHKYFRGDNSDVNVKFLDPTFSVSEGAANFCFQSKELGWKISETTTEDIFIKKNGVGFIKVLPSNRPIPDTEHYISEFDLKKTIEAFVVEETTNVFWLEFYSGSSDTDTNISLVYDAKIDFGDIVIEKDTVLTKVEGWIDKNKIYNFELTFQNPYDEDDHNTYSLEFKPEQNKINLKPFPKGIKLNGIEL